MKFWLSVIILCLPFYLTQAQGSFVVNGYISDAATGERLNGATVAIKGINSGTITNDYGFYSLTLPAGNTTLYFSFIGYKTDTIHLDIKQNISVNVHLHKGNTLSEIKVSGITPIERRNDISAITLNMSQVEKMPSFLGEHDLLKAVQLLPGVQTGQEGNSGLYVRGGGPDENLILLDGVPVYNVSHLFGFFSIFTPEAIQSVELIKGGFPARYGGRLSSVLDIRMKEGDLEKYKGDVGIGLLSSRLTFQGPIKKDVSSFIVSARRSYWDVLASPFMKMAGNSDGSQNIFGYYFQDFNAKLNYKLSNKNKIW